MSKKVTFAVLGGLVCLIGLASLVSCCFNKKEFITQLFTKAVGPNHLNKSQLTQDIEKHHSVMWIGAHPDDEMFIAGTLGYLCKDKGYDCTLVSFGSNPKLKQGNNQTADYLGAEYLRIEERIQSKNPKCPDKDFDCFVKTWKENGAQAELEKILLAKKPDLIFTFGMEEKYGNKDVHYASGYISEQALSTTGLDSHLYYLINTMHLATKDADQRIKLASDILELTPKLWKYKMKIISFYAPFYSPNDLQRLVDNEELQKTQLHLELFKRIR